MKFTAISKIQIPRDKLPEFITVFNGFGFSLEADDKHVTINRLWMFKDHPYDFVADKLEWLQKNSRSFKWDNKPTKIIGMMFPEDGTSQFVIVYSREPWEIVKDRASLDFVSRIEKSDFFDDGDVENDPLDVVLRIKL